MAETSDLALLQAAGVLGFLLYIGTFSAVQFALMNGNGMAFSIANTLAAMLVAVSLIAEFNLATALIQGSWIVIGIVGIATRRFRANVEKVNARQGR